ncbi:MAG: OmpH family outer membrane protein [Flavobacteriaceae bacterium]|nr:OmpH family outer membrane protein [Flavobacteriaceae bacterium]
MKQLKCLLIATIFFLGANLVSAQSKSAHVEVGEIMAKMPAILEAQKQLEKLSIEYQAVYKTMGEEFQAKIKKYDVEAVSVSEKMNIERQKEIQDMEKRIQEYAQTAQKELQTKETDLMKPIQEKIRAAIQKVGKAKGFQYVLNSESLLLADGPNLTVDVKKELGF